MPGSPVTNFTVIAVRDLASQDRARLGKRDKLVTFRLSDGTIDSLPLPAETFNQAAIVAAVKVYVTEHVKWTGQVHQL